RNATAACSTGLTRCTETTDLCTDLTTTLNCGACDTATARAGSQGKCNPDQQCVKSGANFQCSKFCGADAPASCPQNGGGFGVKCGSGLVCNNGQCSLSCATGLAVCGSTCVNTQTDPNNCGGCTTASSSFACASGFACHPNGPNNSGVCEISCPSGQIACSGKCVDISKDSNNCGACGTVCASGQICQNNACVLTCTAGQVACNGKGVDTQSDRANRGRRNR